MGPEKVVCSNISRSIISWHCLFKSVWTLRRIAFFCEPLTFSFQPQSIESKSCSSESADYPSYDPHTETQNFKLSGSKDYIDDSYEYKGKVTESVEEYFQDDFPPPQIMPSYEKRNRSYPPPLLNVNDTVLKSNVTVYSSSVRMKMSQTTTLKNTTNILYLVLPSKYSVSDNSLVAITGNNTIVITQNMNDTPMIETSLKAVSKGPKANQLQNSIASHLKSANIDGGLLRNRSGNFTFNFSKDVNKREKRDLGETAMRLGENTTHPVMLTDMSAAVPPPPQLIDGKAGKNEPLGESEEKYFSEGQWTEYFDEKVA